MVAVVSRPRLGAESDVVHMAGAKRRGKTTRGFDCHNDWQSTVTHRDSPFKAEWGEAE